MAFAAYCRDDEVLKSSSSGGIFSCIAEEILKNDGKVYGAALDEERCLTHIGIDDRKLLERLRKSKYIQSDTKKTFAEVKSDLKKDRMVLYVGTPCQIAGLQLFLGKKHENLLTLDVICHGVPSQKLFNAYVQSLEDKHKGRVTRVDFRDKTRNGWSITLSYDIEGRDGVKRSYFVRSTFSSYFSGFLAGVTLRESCYKCYYASMARAGDITMADYWGYQRVFPDIDSKRGLSLLLVNTDSGKRILEGMGNRIWKREVTIEQACMGENINLHRPTPRPEARSIVYGELLSKGYSCIEKKYLRPKNYYLRVIKSKVPLCLRKAMKRILGIQYQ